MMLSATSFSLHYYSIFHGKRLKHFYDPELRFFFLIILGIIIIISFYYLIINNLDLSELRNSVSLAFQESFLFSNTAKENIAIGLKDATQEEIENAANVARAHEFIAELPEAYETTVGERGYGLSGGQRQRVALARAILRNPRILVLDDALSAVDASTEEEIRNELNSAMKDMTTLIITNRVPTIELCDEVIFIENGKVKAQGKHEDMIKNDEAYMNLFLEEERLKSTK